MIYLLDLNYTLVENSDEKRSPFVDQIAIEQYRAWLIDLLRPERVFLITARPATYERMTLKHIEQATGWRPERAYFNKHNLPPAATKEAWLKAVILKEFAPDELYGLESNPITRGMYKRYGIRSEPVSKREIWTQLPPIAT